MRLIVIVMALAGMLQSASAQTNAGAAPDPAGIAAAVEAYRVMWRGLTPEQQNKALQSGGYTPDQYERVLRQNTGGGAAGRAAQSPGTPDYNRGVSEGALDTLGGSLRDLNAIRDANVARLQKDGCPPDVALRIAELKGKLAANHVETPNRVTSADPTEVAKAWFRSASSGGAGNTSAADSLDSVLPVVAAETRLAGKPQAPLQDAAGIQAEIDRLQGACIAPKR